MLQREIDPEIRADIEKFEEQLGPLPRRATSRRTPSASSA